MILGEKVEIIEKKSIEQKDKEAALRQQGMMEELARKEDERKAYEEVIYAETVEVVITFIYIIHLSCVMCISVKYIQQLLN